MIYEIEVRMLPPREYSGNSRVHWHLRHNAGKLFGQAVFYMAINKRNLALLAGEPIPMFAYARLDLTVVYTVQRDRDADNIIAMFKPGLDALVRAEVLSGDDVKRLQFGDVNVEVDKVRGPLTIIKLMERSER